MNTTIGIDVGGTFTDIVVSTAGRTIIAKAATTPADQSDGVLAGIALAAERLGMTVRDLLGDTSRIVHGTTVATNALLEGKAARVAMLTTAGHRDVVEMREGLKPDRYNLRMTPPAPLVPRRLRLAVTERVRADGSIEIPLDRASLNVTIGQLRDASVQSVAICFLHAWRNPVHEQLAEAAVREAFPGLYVTTSFEVLPQIKEYERFSTTVANAAVGPVIRNYLGRLQSRLRDAGYDRELLVILSHGGVASVDEATRLAAGTALSGPAGGVAAAVALSRAGLAANIIGFDMGGTSTDIAVVRNGQPTLSGDKAVAGARIALPSLDIITLGAGGGSIGKLDRAGLLGVGPESAGAVPGPACYGQGGAAATVTDANLVLGYLDPANFRHGGERRVGGRSGHRHRRCRCRDLSRGEQPHGRCRSGGHGPARRRPTRLHLACFWRGRWGARERCGRRTWHRPRGRATGCLRLVGLGHAEHRPSGGTQPQPGADRPDRHRGVAGGVRHHAAGGCGAAGLVRRRAHAATVGRHALRGAGLRDPGRPR